MCYGFYENEEVEVFYFYQISIKSIYSIYLFDINNGYGGINNY